MINNVRNTVMSILSKDNRGYITPLEFNLWAKQAQMEIFEEDFYNLSNSLIKQTNRVNSSGYSDMVTAFTENIERFREVANSTYSNGYFSLPTDLHLIENVIYNGTTEVEKVPGHKILALNRSLDTAPTTLYPAYVKSNDGLQIYPTTIQSSVTITYIRVPKDPKWTYTSLSAGEPVFNQSANDYQDFELPLVYEPRLVVKILQYAGISIGENEIASAASNAETQDKQEKL